MNSYWSNSRLSIIGLIILLASDSQGGQEAIAHAEPWRTLALDPVRVHAKLARCRCWCGIDPGTVSILARYTGVVSISGIDIGGVSSRPLLFRGEAESSTRGIAKGMIMAMTSPARHFLRGYSSPWSCGRRRRLYGCVDEKVRQEKCARHERAGKDEAVVTLSSTPRLRAGRPVTAVVLSYI